MDEPDPGLVRAAAAGDLEAFEQLVREHQAYVWRFLRRLLGDDAIAEDVTQETFLRVYLRLDSFAFQSKFSTWVLQIARNAGIDELRRQRRRPTLGHEADTGDDDAPGRRGEVRGAPPSAPADVLVELQAALDSLPTHQRAALVLVEMLGFRYREAALVLGVAEGTVKSRVFHARLRLHRWANPGTATGSGRPANASTATESDEGGDRDAL